MRCARERRRPCRAGPGAVREGRRRPCREGPGAVRGGRGVTVPGRPENGRRERSARHVGSLAGLPFARVKIVAGAVLGPVEIAARAPGTRIKITVAADSRADGRRKDERAPDRSERHPGHSQHARRGDRCYRRFLHGHRRDHDRRRGDERREHCRGRRLQALPGPQPGAAAFSGRGYRAGNSAAGEPQCRSRAAETGQRARQGGGRPVPGRRALSRSPDGRIRSPDGRSGARMACCWRPGCHAADPLGLPGPRSCRAARRTGRGRPGCTRSQATLAGDRGRGPRCVHSHPGRHHRGRGGGGQAARCADLGPGHQRDDDRRRHRCAARQAGFRQHQQPAAPSPSRQASRSPTPTPTSASPTPTPTPSATPSPSPSPSQSSGSPAPASPSPTGSAVRSRAAAQAG